MKYKNLTSRFVSVLLAVVMVVSMLPVSAVAEPAEETEQSGGPIWEQGTIASANGQNDTGATRLRTVNYLPLSNYAGAGINSGYTMTNFVYDGNYTYLGTSSWLGDGMPFTTAELQDKYPTGVYFRVVFRAMDQRRLTEADVSASGVKFYMPGEEVPTPDLGFTAENIGNIGSWQDGAIWDGKLFALGAAGTGAVFDVATGVRLGTLTLDKKDSLKPHANSVCFGSTYYAEGDKYPLLYVNIYNNYASATDRMEGTCCVYRVTEENGAFTTELVQVIRIGFTEDLTLWKSKENNGDVRPYGNFVVDIDADKLYAFVMRDANKTTRFFGFDIPGVEEGTYAESYGCNVVTLETDDIRTQFDSAYHSYLQGCCYSSGMILYVGDFGGDAPLYLVDLESQRVKDIFFLGHAGLRAEPEVICADPVSGVLYYAAADGVLRKIVLDDIHLHSYETAVTAPTCTEQGYTTYTCECGDSYVADYVEVLGHTYENGICTICKYESSTALVITEFVNGTYSGNSLTFYPNTRLRHAPISVKAGDQCSFSLPDGWSGYICLAYRDRNWDYAPKAWVQEYSYTFQTDMDAFVVMRKDDNSVISPEEYAGEIIFTKNKVDPDCDVHFRDYYQNEIDRTIESVKALIDDEPCLVFPMVSDIHYLEYAKVPHSFDYFIANLKELAKEINFDFIACLGDITEGDTTQEITSDRNAHIINGFTQLGVPYYQVIGNHDDNRYGDATFTHEQLYENYLSTIEDVVFDTSSMHKTNYYKDFDDLGIRCIFLNANTNGAYGYSNETCDWFEEAIKTENSIIVFTHIPPIPEQNYGAKYGTDRGSARIREICENADNFLIMFSGHNHYDLAITDPFLSFTMNCQKFENENGDPNLWAEGAVKPQRVMGTESEDCFDIVVVRPESGRIDLIRFGAGEDRSFRVESAHTHSYTITVTSPTCTEQGYTTYTCECGDSYVGDYVDATGHTYKNGLCAICGENEPAESMSLRYDDHIDMSSKTVEIVDAGTPSSCKVGAGLEDGTLDDAVITQDGDTLIATGIGTAKVRINGKLYEVEVTPAPISLFMITGHSMGAGQSGSKDLSVIGPDGQVYSSHGTSNLSTSTAGVGISYAAQQKANGINAFTEAGTGTIGEGSALAWEWNRLTGEKVWVLNTAVGGSCLAEWIPGTTNYNRAVAQYQRAQMILSNEIAAGHYTLGHMGILYHNGANFSYKNVTFTQQDLQNWYDAMWSGFKSDFVRDMDGNGTEETVSFLGLVPIWTKSAGVSYTQDEPAGLFMAASEEYPDIFTVSVIGQEWLTNANVAANFPEITYEPQNGTVPERPDTTAEVFASDGVHYQQVGYNAVGIDIAQNLHCLLKTENELTEVNLVTPKPLEEIPSHVELSYGEELMIVPLTEPVTVSGLEFVADGSIAINYPLVIVPVENGAGTLTVSLGGVILKTITFTCTGVPEPAQSLSLRYDDHYDVTGKTVEIVDAGEAVIALEGNYLVATGVGTATVRIDGIMYEVVVEKAKISVVVIMGQSNAGNHFANATSDITCPPGTAYWWGNGQGTAATEPVPYTQPSMGFHTPLLAELYAQSVATGDPVKNVMIWQEGITSRSGRSITSWVPAVGNTSGMNSTVAMIENCLSYYAQRSDRYEIASKGVYWYQGESDVSMDPDLYTALFMDAWGRLKDAGMEYTAFFRVRKGVAYNGRDNAADLDHEDLDYHMALAAQLKMINENPEFFMATTLTEHWTGTEDTQHTVDIGNYITVMEAYGGSASHTDGYGNTATYADGKLTTTMKTLFGSNNYCHYGKFGAALIGADAAYNMYRALHGNEFAIVQADSSGKPERQTISGSGTQVELDTTGITEHLAFRASCGSTAGTMEIAVRSGEEDITDDVICTGGNNYGTVDTRLLRQYDNVTVAVTYTPVNGSAGTVVYTITDNTPDDPKLYLWDFEQDLYARDKNGTIINGFFSDALHGSYILQDGMLKAVGLQLQLQESIRLEHEQNWSVEWKFGEVTELSSGFLLCNTKISNVGTKAIYHIKDQYAAVGRFCLSDYAGSAGYTNYSAGPLTVKEGDTVRIINTYDPVTGQSTQSLYLNGCWVSNFLYNGNSVSGDFEFCYLGCQQQSNLFYVTDELEYLKIITEDAAHPLSLRYDDHYDVTGKTVEIVDAGTPTSYQVGYGVMENTVPDTAVVALEGDTLVATGIGTALVLIDGILYEITVEAAPISLLLLAGQSNMQGIDGNAAQSVICPDGMVYATYADRYKKTVEDVTKFAPGSLTGVHSTINVTGDTACLENYPVNMLTEAGNGREGMDSGLAYEWVQQTGEKVWVVNLGYGGSSINGWLEGGEHYQACLDLFAACQETLRKEIAAGHYTLSHMGYFWCQGCADETQTAAWYVQKYLTMHELFKETLSFDHDSDSVTPDKSMEFAGIIPIRSGHSWMGSYRAGVYKDSTTVPYYQSFLDLRFNGPRVAQYWMGNNPELADIWYVCTLQEEWATLPDGTDGVEECFRSRYENGRVDYTVQVTQPESWYTPKTPADVHDNIHYNQIGYNEIGRESARNALIMLGDTDAPETETTVEFLGWDGFTPAEEIPASSVGSSATLVVPIVFPVWKAKEVVYAVGEGLRYEYYDLLADTPFTAGTLFAVGAEGSVAVNPRELTSYRWFFDGAGLVSDNSDGFSENALVKLAGSVSNGLFSGIRYQTSQSVQLLHNEAWCVEVELGNWTATSGSMILSSSPDSATGEPYFYFRPRDFFVGIGCYNGTTYDNYGISLKEHGISCSEGTHTYRFINRIDKDGTNMIWLIVDDQEIGALTDHYINSTLNDRENTWLSGRDFAMPYLGTSFAPISNCAVNSITVIETGYTSDFHIHSWSDWETVTTPGPDGPGTERRTCAGCGEEEIREVEGVWQTHDLAVHLSELPENLCAGLNLWSVLEHDAQYYHSGTHWGVHESGQVWSVTIPVTGGEHIYATSFGKYGENGNTIGTGNGIRVTFFDAKGVLKTLSPADTYAEFSANGWLTVPEGAVAVNVPMYSNSDANELYILNRDHHFVAGLCTICGHDSVEISMDNSTLTVTCDDMEPDTLIWLVSYDGNRKFVAMKRVTLGATLTLPAGERCILFFVDANWTPLRKQLEL